MIVRMLVDLSGKGELYMMTIETKDEQKLFSTLKRYYTDVRFLEEKKNSLAVIKEKEFLMTVVLSGDVDTFVT